jgi:hypothetical protein
MSASEAVYMMFSPQAWDSQHSRTRALAIELSKQGRRTIYVNPPNSVAGVARESIATLLNPLRRENIHFSRDFEMLEVWTPPTLPTFYRGSLTPGFDRWMFKAWFEKRISRIKKPIIAVIAMPYWWDGFLNDYAKDFSALFFDYQDPVGTYARNVVIRRHMSEVFSQLVSQVDGVITHTQSNYRNMSVHRKPEDVCLIRNAGNGVSSRRETLSSAARMHGHPVIGTVGRISQNIDVTLLSEIADHFIGGTVVNIGTVSVHARRLKAKKNIVLMPPMLPDDLRSNIHNFDIGILPYQANIEGSPLRVYDLLSELLQVVSTNFGDSEYFKNIVHVANSRDEFLAKTADLLSSNKNWIREETIEKFVVNNTWKIRGEELTRFCENILGR